MYEYDVPGALRPGGTPLTRRLLAMGGDLYGKSVLDLGCGRGETVTVLSREYGSIVTGVDISEKMTEEGKNACPEAEFLQADAGMLPFSDGSFDAVVSECSFSVFDDPGKVFAEVKRILKKGGSLLMSDLCQKGGILPGKGMVRNLYTPEEWNTMLLRAGFETVSTEDAGKALSEMYIQMILDEGIERANERIGLCLGKDEMKKVSYMLFFARSI